MCVIYAPTGTIALLVFIYIRTREVRRFFYFAHLILSDLPLLLQTQERESSRLV